MRKHRAVIVDDERLARREMRSLLSAYPQIEIAGEADDIVGAAELIGEQKADVVFLDIQLSGETGFDLLERIDPAVKVIFVTAFDAFAIRAFEVNAIDYLLKPVNPERLAAAIERLGKPSERPAALRPLEIDDRVLIESGERSFFIKVSDISHIASAGDYSEVHAVDGRKFLVEKPLREWEERLPEKHFARIHRQSIVNLEEVEALESWFNRTLQVRLKSGVEPLPVSRRFASKLKSSFN
jgi:two-component system, LytTR family, response regulator